MMAANAAALGTGLAVTPAGEHRWALLAAAVVLVTLGLGALLKGAWARWAAVGAAIVAAVFVSEDLIRERLPDLMRDPVPAPIRASLRDLIRPLYPATIFFVMAFLAGSLLLLAGRPRRARIAMGVLLTAPMLVLLAIRVIRG